MFSVYHSGGFCLSTSAMWEPFKAKAKKRQNTREGGKKRINILWPGESECQPWASRTSCERVLFRGLEGMVCRSRSIVSYGMCVAILLPPNSLHSDQVPMRGGTTAKINGWLWAWRWARTYTVIGGESSWQHYKERYRKKGENGTRKLIYWWNLLST